MAVCVLCVVAESAPGARNVTKVNHLMVLSLYHLYLITADDEIFIELIVIGVV